MTSRSDCPTHSDSNSAGKHDDVACGNDS